jgi:Methyltransferase domain
MSMPRSVAPEWLDRLPAHDARAMRSRQDLRRINAWMLQPGIMARGLKRHCDRPRIILDIGAGDGTFLLQVARRLAPQWPDVTAVLLDRQDIVTSQTREEFAAIGWRTETICADVFAFLGALHPTRVDIVTANLFLHHFPANQVAQLFAGTARVAQTFAACEPRRSSMAWFASHMVFALGCNGVTRHDAAVSVRAGFTGRELSGLWPRPGWVLQEKAAPPFSHWFMAQRKASTP